jgi:hypothetical protein
MMPETNAAFLFPLNGELQDHRVQRAARNAEYIATTLKESLKDVPFYDGVFYPAGKEADQYAAKPPFLFIKMNPIFPSRSLSSMSMDFAGLHRLFPETGTGTSYGFDGTRFELIHMGEDHAAYLRIAAGQESVLQLMAITQHIEKALPQDKPTN